MPDYGLLSTGFVPQPLSYIRATLDDEARAKFGASIDVSDRSYGGWLHGILAERLAVIWELLEQITTSSDPDKAAAALLDALCALTGTFRDPASASTATLTLTGTAATVVGAGSLVEAASTGAAFATDASATLAALTAWANTTAYVVGDRRSNSGKSYVCTTAGTSAGSGGPTTTATDITDGTVHWRYLGIGTAAADVAATCTVTGPTVAVSGDLTEIATSVAGWSSVINLLDADVGRAAATDGELRAQREADIARAGTGTDPAVLQALLRVPGVTSARIFDNRSNVTDGDGIPAHTIEALVEGGADQDIWDALLANLPSGPGTYGTEAGSATDSQGNAQSMSFTRPTAVPIYATLEVTVNADARIGAVFPADGAAQIKNAIVAWGDQLGCGRAVTAWATGSQAAAVPGVTDVTSVFIDDAPAPAAGTTIPITVRQRSTWDTSRITVNVTVEGGS